MKSWKRSDASLRFSEASTCTPFEKGIVLTIDWYLNHEEWMNHVTSGDYQNYYQDMYKNK